MQVTLTAAEQRVLGCLIEKRLTTPDQYPLSLNSLRLACNQSTNRNPVTDYDEATVREAAQRLCRHGLARLASGHTSRAIKYRHLAEEALGLDSEQLSVLAVLLLRGPQTPGELKQRSERMAHLETLADIEQVLAALADRDYVKRLHRRPGQKEDRFEHLLGEDEQASSFTPAASAAAAADRLEPAIRYEEGPALGNIPSEPAAEDPLAPPSANGDELGERVAALETQVAELRDEIAALRAQ